MARLCSNPGGYGCPRCVGPYKAAPCERESVVVGERVAVYVSGNNGGMATVRTIGDSGECGVQPDADPARTMYLHERATCGFVRLCKSQPAEARTR